MKSVNLDSIQRKKTKDIDKNMRDIGKIRNDVNANVQMYMYAHTISINGCANDSDSDDGGNDKNTLNTAANTCIIGMYIVHIKHLIQITSRQYTSKQIHNNLAREQRQDGLSATGVEKWENLQKRKEKQTDRDRDR